MLAVTFPWDAFPQPPSLLASWLLSGLLSDVIFSLRASLMTPVRIANCSVLYFSS